MLFDHLPWRVKTRIVRMIFAKQGVVLVDTPRVEGLLPSVRNDGEFIIGRSSFFRTYRVRQSITIREGVKLHIGDNAFINDGVDICANVGITIGDHVKIAPMVAIYDSNYHKISPSEPVKRSHITIGNNVWIGVNAVILPGATIGDHSVIAAGSVVTGPIPSGVIAGGCPAKIIKEFEVASGWIRD